MKKICVAVILSAIVLGLIPQSVNAVSVGGEAAVLMNGHTGTVLYAKNENQKLSMASTTKIMTALILAEQNTPEKEIIVTKEMVTVEGSSMGLLEGDTVTHYALLCGMMLSSGNDAANTTAISLAGSVEQFAKIMNEKASEIGMKNTNFVTPSGLDGDGHYSTAYDMALLAKCALKNETISEIVSSKSIVTEYGNPPYKRRLTNHNKLLSLYDGCIGVKTGYTKKSGRCLVSAAERDGEYLIAVTLDNSDDWNDHVKLFDYGFSVLDTYDLSELCTVTETCLVGSNTDKVKLCCENAKIGLTSDEYEKLTYSLTVAPFLYAPLTIGEKAGEITVFLDDFVVITQDILVSEECHYLKVKEKTFAQKYLEKISAMLHHCK